MKKRLFALCCLLLCTALLFSACGEDKPATNPAASGDGSGNGGTTYENYEEAVNAKDYAAAYTLLLQDTSASETELGKYIVVPTKVTGHSTTAEVDATLTYNAKGLIEKVVIANKETVTFTYDAAGNLTAQVHTETDGDVRLRYDYTYDDNNNRLSRNRTGTSVEEYIAYVYNDKNQLITETLTEKYSYQDDIVTVWTYTYDDAGLVASRMNDSGGGEQYKYDADGRLTEEKEVAASGNTRRYLYEYDEQGRIITERYENSDGTWNEYTYKYDAAGTQYESAYALSDGTATYTVTTDDKGCIVSQDFTSSYGTTSHEEYLNGYVVKKDMTWSSGRAQTYTFAYNEFGYRTAESCANAETTLYDYKVTYDVLYINDGAPDVSEYIAEMQEKDSINLWF